MPSYITPSDQLFEVLCHPGKFIFLFFHFHQILWLTVVNKSNRKNNQLKFPSKATPLVVYLPLENDLEATQNQVKNYGRIEFFTFNFCFFAYLNYCPLKVDKGRISSSRSQHV